MAQFARVCLDCHAVAAPKTFTPGSIWIEIILWLLLFPIGLVYSIWRHTQRGPVCSLCGSKRLVPAYTPAGREVINE